MMEEQTIICPRCGSEIPLGEAITTPLREKLRVEFEQREREKSKELAAKEVELKQRESAVEKQRADMDNAVSERLEGEKQKLEARVRKQVEEGLQTQLSDLSNAVTEKEKLLDEARNTELDLRKKQRELEERAKESELNVKRTIDHERDKLREEFEAASKRMEDEIVKRQEEVSQKEKEVQHQKEETEAEVARQVKAQQGALEKEIRARLDSAYSVELGDLKAQVKEKEERLAKAQEAELELRKERRQLEEGKKAFELEMNRKLDAERQTIREEATKAVREDFRLKDLDKEKLINDLKGQIEELQRKADQGSQERQGEVMEVELESILKANFPLDEIEPVPRGRRGADVLQRVRNEGVQTCGTIIWESKRTKNWNESWVEKLRDDQRDAKAEIAVIFTATLPGGVENFSLHNGVWVTDYSSLIGLATALRISLIQIAEANIAASGKTPKMEVLYNYLSGPMFRQKIEGIVEAFTTMKEDLDAEKRTMGRLWAKRERQIERVINNAVSMYGDMQGIIGASLPEIKSMDLKALAPAEDGKSASDSADDLSNHAR